jgi:hypothetical protein
VSKSLDDYVYVYMLRCVDGSYYVGLTRSSLEEEWANTTPVASADIQPLAGRLFWCGSKISSA